MRESYTYRRQTKKFQLAVNRNSQRGEKQSKVTEQIQKIMFQENFCEIKKKIKLDTVRSGWWLILEERRGLLERLRG